MGAEGKQQTSAGAKADESPDVSGGDAARGAVPVAKRAAIYTMTAREGLDAAELVNAAFKAKKPIGKRAPYRLECVEPDGPSTSGGKRARQTLRLVSGGGTHGPVMIGYLDVSQKLAELRAHHGVAAQYEARFGEPFDVTREEYAALGRDLELMLSPLKYELRLEAEPPAERAPKRQGPREKTPLLSLVLLSVGVLLAATAAIALLR